MPDENGKYTRDEILALRDTPLNQWPDDLTFADFPEDVTVDDMRPTAAGEGAE